MYTTSVEVEVIETRMTTIEVEHAHAVGSTVISPHHGGARAISGVEVLKGPGGQVYRFTSGGWGYIEDVDANWTVPHRFNVGDVIVHKEDPTIRFAIDNVVDKATKSKPPHYIARGGRVAHKLITLTDEWYELAQTEPKYKPGDVIIGDHGPRLIIEAIKTHTDGSQSYVMTTGLSGAHAVEAIDNGPWTKATPPVCQEVWINFYPGSVSEYPSREGAERNANQAKRIALVHRAVDGTVTVEDTR